MAHINTNGVRLHVQRMRQADPGAPPLVFVHGLGDSMACYYFTLAGPVAALGFDVTAYDLRGHGRSDRPPHGYGVDYATGDLAGLLAELRITGPVHLVGYSWGGTVAFRYAHRFPDGVASLVVIESEPPTPGWAERTAGELAGLAAYLADPEWIARAERESALPVLARRFTATARALQATTLAAEVLDRTGLADRYPDGWLRCPLLMVVGGGSGLHARLDTVLGLLPPCDVAVIPGHGHALLASAPQEVAAVVLPWLAARRGALAGAVTP
ncbi:alpha/beta hydrolase [Actinoplanes lobatus]|uniref:Alpha/beta hydrolase n=1 Tax=Actinoplanes lobatus TaxID=113568 RepID=A0A7W7HNA7_9ACTN|nr:alpha/beta hydrolase [Actinoplanes lobatus]MBB4753702.1 pimeloyl-ACP methyl ester carboxylesterase [Actinoplanes lobatus]GGN72938.1 alpha/beta hydrolase [Actinoplanes lobatus]GIE44486.1 alpha/beta hydrolase [Actinoplanes lobatus]